VEEPERRGVNATRPNDPDSSPENDPTAGDPTREVPTEDIGGNGPGAEVADSDGLQRQLEAKDRHIKEVYDELAAARLATDEAVARAEADELRVENLEEERERLKERLRAFEEEERTRRRRREIHERRAARLEREIERRETEIGRLRGMLEEKEGEMEAHDREAREEVFRKNAALEEALRRVEGLERDLEEREDEAARLRDTVDELRAELDLEREHRRRMTEPANRLRVGIELFNDSEHLQAVDSVSKSLGQPEVHVALGEGDEPPVILTFTWRDITWRTYTANPGLAMEEPRVYQMGAGEDLSGVEREASNAHIGPGGRVLLGL
jgi:ribonucrease Y